MTTPMWELGVRDGFVHARYQHPKDAEYLAAYEAGSDLEEGSQDEYERGKADGYDDGVEAGIEEALAELCDVEIYVTDVQPDCLKIRPQGPSSNLHRLAHSRVRVGLL